MRKSPKRCLKCGQPISGTGWLCQGCRMENRKVASEAEGVSDLYPEDN